MTFRLEALKGKSKEKHHRLYEEGEELDLVVYEFIKTRSGFVRSVAHGFQFYGHVYPAGYRVETNKGILVATDNKKRFQTPEVEAEQFLLMRGKELVDIPGDPERLAIVLESLPRQLKTAAILALIERLKVQARNVRVVRS